METKEGNGGVWLVGESIKPFLYRIKK